MTRQQSSVPVPDPQHVKSGVQLQPDLRNVMRILIAEDDRPLCDFLTTAFTGEQFNVDIVHDGAGAVEMATKQDYDIVILDLNFPGVNTSAVVQRLCTARPSLPVLILTAHDSVEDRVQSLNVGADDYLAKPFAFSELLARVRAVLRRSRQTPEGVSRVADLELSRLERRVRRAGRPIALTPREFDLLDYLMRNAGRPVTRTMILENAWSIYEEADSNIVDVYINYLRRKVDKQFDRKLIRTVRGIGYQLDGQSNGGGECGARKAG